MCPGSNLDYNNNVRCRLNGNNIGCAAIPPHKGILPIPIKVFNTRRSRPVVANNRLITDDMNDVNGQIGVKLKKIERG